MRTIKFRGKGRRAGNWFFGNLFIGMYGCTHIFSLEVGGLEVIPETIGQFSGLYDCNGNKIYEGDIVEWEKDGLMYVVKFWNGMFYASVKECNDGIFGGFPLHALTKHDDRKCKIAGNIHDNPELLKGGKA